VLAALSAAAAPVFWSPEPDGAGAPAPEPEPTTPLAGTSSPVTPTPTTPPRPVLSTPGDFPTDGPGTFRYATTEGSVLGGSGTLVRFRLAIEDPVDEDPDGFARFVDETLGGEQGWTAGAGTRFQRVPDGAPSDITIYLATGGTTARMCAGAGMTVVSPGLPDGGVSCHFSGQVVINLARWRLSVPHYVSEGVPLETYRQMVLNHEVGHALGLGHEACPGPGEPAPVMQQQTIKLDGCLANAWPYLDGRRYSGQPVG
jgi:hypothetical protein